MERMELVRAGGGGDTYFVDFANHRVWSLGVKKMRITDPSDTLKPYIITTSYAYLSDGRRKRRFFLPQHTDARGMQVKNVNGKEHA